MYPDEALQTLTDYVTDDEARRAVATLRELVAMLERLCPCDTHWSTTDGPEQECPLHGDGVMFVTDVKELLLVQQAARAVVNPNAGRAHQPARLDALRRALAGRTD